MKAARRDILICILLCGGFGVLWGTWLETTSYAPMLDFKAVYYGARCLLHHRDPYNPKEFRAVYGAEGEKLPADPAKLRRVNPALFVCINLPTSLLTVAPLAMLPWEPAHWLWLALIAGGLMLAAFVILECSGRYALEPALLLVGVVLADMGSLILVGNLAGVVISFCVLAAWCFLNDRLVSVGTVCLALALALKPHDSALVWFYFVLAGGVYRRRALRALLITAALAFPAFMWVSHTAPSWPHELQANLAAGSAKGGLNDPGPDSLSFNGPDTLINLQSSFSVIRDDPRFYNSASYLICGILFLIGAIRTARVRFSPTTAWFAIAAIAALSLLPVYHRGHDAKLLLLTIPACSLLWAEGGAIRWFTFLLSTAAIGVTSVIPWTFLLVVSHHLSVRGGESLRQMLPIVLTQLAPLSLLVVGIFYLWVYWRRTAVPSLVPKS